DHMSAQADIVSRLVGDHATGWTAPKGVEVLVCHSLASDRASLTEPLPPPMWAYSPTESSRLGYPNNCAEIMKLQFIRCVKGRAAAGAGPPGSRPARKPGSAPSHRRRPQSQPRAGMPTAGS